jgi:hypothetical protein
MAFKSVVMIISFLFGSSASSQSAGSWPPPAGCRGWLVGLLEAGARHECVDQPRGRVESDDAHGLGDEVWRER